MNEEIDGYEEIVKDFLSECSEHLDTLDSGFVAIEQNHSDRKILAEIFRSIHTIKGGAGMLAFPNLEKLTHAAENLLSLLRDGKLSLTTDMITTLLKTVDSVRSMLDNIAKTSNDGQDVHQGLIAELQSLQQPKPQPVAQIVEQVVEQVVEQIEDTSCEEAISHHEADLLDLADNIVSDDMTDMSTETSNTVVEDEVTEVLTIEHLTSETSCEPESVTSDPHFEAHIEKAMEEQIPTATEHGVVAKTQHDDELAHENRSLSTIDTTIRINVELLDKLMNLVGELVLSRNQILQFISALSDSSFIAVSQRLNLITSELQEGVMKTRMQPIGNVWSKFTRIVRDLATTCNKKVNLVMVGKETELDKTLIEAIKDPLTHIVRNSVDHGIELPEKRRKNGKSEDGTITLRAYHEGGHVNIEIIDDGAGIAAEKVKTKALDKGLITAEQAARMTERDALNLIFLPGLSTAEKVTNISGRGVGMDVVRTNIERINGTIELQSKPGFSTIIKIKIPLTLAIIPALIITCQDNRYAIPQISLLELVRLEPHETDKHIQYIKDHPVYKLRGKLLPLVYLNKELELNDGTLLHQSQPINIVILQAGEIEFGLVVDSINDTQEIVVKPLSKLLKNQLAFAGATIMGDGKISLILDVVGIARKANLLSSPVEANKLAQLNQQQEERLEKQTLLLLSAGSANLIAVPLEKVDRIEEFSSKMIELIGSQEVVQYRDNIMPLVRLDKFIGNHLSKGDMEKVQVIVHSDGFHNFGLIVDKVYDIVEGMFKLDREIKRQGVVGASVIDDKITEILDIESIMRKVLPMCYDQGATRIQ